MISSPMSFTGSASRLWRLTTLSDNIVLKVCLIALTVTLILCAWVLVVVWYVIWVGVFGVFFFLWRLWRRSSRQKKEVAKAKHEGLMAIRNGGKK